MIAPPTHLAPLLERPVAILGGGVSGSAAAALVEAAGGTAVIYDERPGRGVSFSEAAAGRHAVAVHGPGFAPNHPWLLVAAGAGLEVLTELDFAAAWWQGPAWAVTGTNGKSTLVGLLAEALRRGGQPAKATGNVGYAFSSFVRDAARGDFPVVEVSSFQAETLRYFAPEAVLWTNFDEDHLDRHGTMAAYFAAKWHLVQRVPGGHLWCGGTVAAAARSYGQDLPVTAHVVGTCSPAPDPDVAGTGFDRPPQDENWMLASAFWENRGLPRAALVAAARSAPVPAHRLVRVGEERGVTFWDDSKGTNFHAVRGALRGFGRPPHWIGGGKSKGGDLDGFIASLAGKVVRAYLVGETAAELAAACLRHGVAHEVSGDLATAVRSAFQRAVPGDAVLLSPGFASFDQFTDYADRGRRFTSLVAGLRHPVAVHPSTIPANC